ncbi:1,4-dihydroxy-2-naphthoate polyprenyltransferase [Aeromonas schubertii]|uniref:1,4-dihydroxy-2-naphthoate octaprenyltransferase n=1 Tax=Aeromonas schubertii TaxID=652 RepID=A0A0S2SIM1_9GAMM|nr:1,4-dihydroxy-2-naphthoate polyprenyltransferase [Aeromonas schubertii]ALP41536.1 1, 4-dihydroxy-2-naphthoate octaprenyltransferase [Aeromonas schubertii]KUE80930.1 1,4-dihydroxy-2-naphthoate octaprenyltransferase [Aeromonas schubertii]
MRKKINAWVMAARLRTLPLACSSILLGSGLAASRGSFDGAIMGLALLTAILLQILSNLANDYGDAVSGADNGDRIGPQRAVVSGLITRGEMVRAMALVALGSVASGLGLLITAFGHNWLDVLLFVALGGFAIIAAITYTVGKTPYGYRGLGDISVFLFFGLLGVLGSFYLFTHSLNWELLLPAAACGLLATAVLNINNVRDIESDAASGKITLAVRLGRDKAIAYHWVLLGGAVLLTLIFLLIHGGGAWPWIFLPALKPLTDAARTLSQTRDGEVLTGALKRTAMGSFLYSLLLSAGLALGA